MSVCAEVSDGSEETRRDFLYLVTGAMAALGTASAAWPFIDSLNPAADIRALSTIEVDLAPIDVGQRITAVWRGQPLFIDHRTSEQIARAKADDAAELKDPEPDSARVQREEWLIVVGVCTWAVFPWAKSRGNAWANGAGGSALVTAPTTTPRDGSARARHPRTSWSHPMASSTNRWCASGSGRAEEQEVTITTHGTDDS
jgi:ubiquinol-cytochrome c reductase iron-sulfur subunit